MYRTYGSDMARSLMHDRMREADHYRLTKEIRQAHAGRAARHGPEDDEGLRCSRWPGTSSAEDKPTYRRRGGIYAPESAEHP